MSTDQTATATNNTEAAPQTAPVSTEVPAPVVSEAAPAVTPPTEKSESTQTPVVPEKYELKLSEGSLLAPEAVQKIEEFAKANKLSQEKAQELLTREETLIKSHVDSQLNAHNERIESWKVAASKDKEIGGEAFGQNAELAKRAVEKFGSAELKQMLDATGFGNHPEVIRVFARIGKAMSEDKIISGGAPPSAPKKSIAEKFYGGQKQT